MVCKIPSMILRLFWVLNGEDYAFLAAYDFYEVDITA
jgi:hypothetical protein